MSHDEIRYLLNFQYKKAMPPRYPCTILETIIKSILKLCYSQYFVKSADSRGYVDVDDTSFITNLSNLIEILEFWNYLFYFDYIESS